MDGQRKIYVRTNVPTPTKYKLAKSASQNVHRPSIGTLSSSPSSSSNLSLARQGSSLSLVSEPLPLSSSATPLSPPLPSVPSVTSSVKISPTSPILVTPGSTFSPTGGAMFSPPILLPRPSTSMSLTQISPPHSPRIVHRPVTNGNMISDPGKARAERKIMDLEITNTSLLSINKYLEKRIRRQEKDIENLQLYVKSGDFLQDIDNSSSSSEWSESDNDSDSHSDYSLDAKDNDDERLSQTGHFNNIEYDNANLDSIDEKTRRAQERSNAHIAFLRQTEKTNKILRNCLQVTETLLKEAQTSLEYQVEPNQVKIGRRGDEDEEEN